MSRADPCRLTPPSREARQRLDKWLWFARVVKTRSLAAKLVEDGHVRINSSRVEDPAKALKIGDVVTIALERSVRVLKVLAPGDAARPLRGGQALFEDLSRRRRERLDQRT